MARWLSPVEARRLLARATEVHRGGQEPTEILAKLAELQEAARQATLFIARFRVVDEGMINSVAQLRLEYDSLHAVWDNNHHEDSDDWETPAPTLH